MADVFEQNLPSKANLSVATNGDYLRVVGSDNNSYKQLVNDVAKKIIENYTNSSLAGANQSVKAALDSLNSKIQRYVGNITTGNSCSFRYAESDPNRYHYGLLVGGQGTSMSIMCYVYISNVSNNFDVQVVPLIESSTQVSGSSDGAGTITFTVTKGNAYGGLRYIDLS